MVSVTALIHLVIATLSLGSLTSLVSVGLSLILGVGGIINVAYGEFMVISMFITYFLNLYTGIYPTILILITTPLFFVLGIITYYGVIRRIMVASRFSQLLVTFGLLLVIRYTAIFFWTTSPKVMPSEIYTAVAFQIFGLNVGMNQLQIILISAIANLVMFLLLNKSKMGKAMRAVAQHRVAAQAVGIDLQRIDSLVWGFSTAAAGVAGSLLTLYYPIHPGVGSLFTLSGFAAVVLGGFGNPQRAFFSGLLIGGIMVFGGFFGNASLKLVYVFLVFLAVLVLRPRRILYE